MDSKSRKDDYTDIEKEIDIEEFRESVENVENSLTGLQVHPEGTATKWDFDPISIPAVSENNIGKELFEFCAS